MKIKIAFFIFLSASLIIVASQLYELPPSTSSNDKYIRLNQIQQVNEPEILLSKIYKREVYKVTSAPDDENSSMITEFSPCKQSPPQISFKKIGYYQLETQSNPFPDPQQVTNSSQPVRKPSSIIYDYEVLKAKYQNIIDMVFFNNTIYTISSSALISVYAIRDDSENGIQKQLTLKGVDWDALYRLRLLKWQLAEQKFKQSLTTNSSQTNDDNISSLLGQQNRKPNQALDQNIKTSSRVLQQAFYPPSPQVREQRQSEKQLEQNSSKTTQKKEKFYTGPPPERPKGHLQKGYLQLMLNNSLLIFANNQYLIGFDILKRKTILFSEQPQYDSLRIVVENVTKNVTNSSDIQNDSGSDMKKKNEQPNQFEPNDSPQKQEQKVMPQFTPLLRFEEIAKINETHFALVDRRAGVFIYQILKKTIQKSDSQQKSTFQQTFLIKKTLTIAKSQFGKSYEQNQDLNLVDIAYNFKKGLLIVLDYEKGVFTFQSLGTDASFILSSSTIIKKMCSLMQFSQASQTLYLSCNKIYRISMAKWPKITQKIFPHPLINIREIFIEEDMDIFILSGFSVFKVMYLDRTANYFQDDMLDKIIFNRETVITANQNHIVVLKYKLDKPTVYCQSNNRSLVGSHTLMLRTTAECSESYIKSLNFKKPGDRPVDQDDVCVYTTYKNIYIWEQGQVPLKPLAIIMLVFLIFFCVMLIWFVLVKFRMQRAQQHLKYLSEEGRKQLVEQNIEQDNQTQEKNFQKTLVSEDKRSDREPISEQQDPNKHLYSIE